MDSLEILNAVNAFYDQSFTRLLTATFGLIAFIGVLVPLLVGWVQLRTLRAEKGALLAELKLEIAKEREALRSEIEGQVEERVETLRTEYEARFEEISKKLKRSSEMVHARTHHLQGLSFINRGKFHLAIEDFCHAAPLYIKAGDEANAQRCLRSLVEKALPRTTANQYLQFKIDDKCKALVADLEEHDENGRYQNDIQRIEREMDKAKKRDPLPVAAEANA